MYMQGHRNVKNLSGGNPIGWGKFGPSGWNRFKDIFQPSLYVPPGLTYMHIRLRGSVARTSIRSADYEWGRKKCVLVAASARGLRRALATTSALLWWHCFQIPTTRVSFYSLGKYDISMIIQESKHEDFFLN